MAGVFDYLFQDQPVMGTQTASSSSNAPDWYSDYIRGIGGKASELASRDASRPIPQQSVAGFAPDQLQAFQQVRQNQGAFRPYTDAAAGQYNLANANADQATGAVAGPSRDFTQSWAQYMSPYTQGVVNEIARLGNKNFSENVMPTINASMIGSGQFGSTRNADVLGRAATEAQSAITGQQASALEAGFNTAGNLFNQDANRAQQQQQLQAQTALGAGALRNTTGQNFGALGQAVSGLGLQDAQALQATGQQQQQMDQLGLDTAYNNTIAANNWDWSTLDRLNSLTRGMQLPTTSTAVNTGPLSRAYTPAPLTQLGTTVGSLFS